MIHKLIAVIILMLFSHSLLACESGNTFRGYFVTHYSMKNKEGSEQDSMGNNKYKHYLVRVKQDSNSQANIVIMSIPIEEAKKLGDYENKEFVFKVQDDFSNFYYFESIHGNIIIVSS